VVQTVLINAPLTYLASERYLGRTITIAQAYRATAGRLILVTVALILFYIMISILTAVVVFLTAFLIGIILYGALIYIAIAMYAFLLPIMVLERVGIFLAFGRTWMLGRIRFWPLFWLTIASLTIVLFTTLGLTWLSATLISSTSTSNSFVFTQVIETVIRALIGIFINPVLPIAFTLMYYDTRIRTEGLDIVLHSLDKPDPRPSDVVSPPPGEFLGRHDWRNIGLVTVVTLLPIVLYLCLAFAFIGSLGRGRF
jgi:hypothetical protein